MEMNVCLDANVARLVHMNWVLELVALVKNGKENGKIDQQVVDAHAVDHQDCELGRWLYGRACHQYADSNQVWPLSDIHQKLHSEAYLVFKMIQQESWHEVDRLMGEINYLSREVIYLLTCIELDILEKDKHPVFSTYNTLKGLLNKKTLQGNSRSVATFRNCDVNKSLMVPFSGGGSGILKNSPQKVDQIKKLNMGRLAHIRWMNGLRNTFINFRDAELPPAEQCDLGMWIHHDDHRFLDGHELLDDLDSVHKEFHYYASKTVSAMRNNRYQGYGGFYHKSLILSKEITYLLTRMEYDFEGGDNIAARMGVAPENEPKQMQGAETIY